MAFVLPLFLCVRCSAFCHFGGTVPGEVYGVYGRGFPNSHPVEKGGDSDASVQVEEPYTGLLGYSTPCLLPAAELWSQ